MVYGIYKPFADGWRLGYTVYDSLTNNEQKSQKHIEIKKSLYKFL